MQCQHQRSANLILLYVWLALCMDSKWLGPQGVGQSPLRENILLVAAIWVLLAMREDVQHLRISVFKYFTMSNSKWLRWEHAASSLASGEKSLPHHTKVRNGLTTWGSGQHFVSGSNNWDGFWCILLQADAFCCCCQCFMTEPLFFVTLCSQISQNMHCKHGCWQIWQWN